MPNPEASQQNDPAAPTVPRRPWAIIGFTALIALAGLANLVFWTSLALQPEDTEASESPWILTITRLLKNGPTELYGPFFNGHRLVLIHPPVYYHLAALMAWPLVSLGCDPDVAAIISGRSISYLSLMLLPPIVFRLTRLDGTSRLAGVWATCLVVGSPILGGMPFTIRADMLGILFQTAGILCVCMAVRQPRPRPRLIYLAFAMFGTALCIKQHFAAAAAVSLLITLAAWRERRLSLRVIERSIFLLIAIVIAVYGFEELLSRGHMVHALLGASSAIRRIAPGGIDRVSLVSMVTLRHTMAMTALLAAAAASLCLTSHSYIRKGFGMAGTLVLGAGFVAYANQFRIASVTVESVIIILILPFLLLMLASQGWPSRLLGSRYDATLWLFVAAEFTVAAALWWLSTGAWFNYSIQATVLLAVLVARATARAVDSFSTSSLPAIPLLLAALIGVVTLALDIEKTRAMRAIDDLAIELVLKNINRNHSEIYFVDNPGANRLHGNQAMVHDAWLYPIFEASRLAEPRAVWLERALTIGPIRAVVNSADKTRIDDLKPTLYSMGFVPDVNVGPFYVWLRPSTRPGQGTTP